LLDGAAGFRYGWTAMEELVDDFLSYLRNERGHSEHTQKTYAALLDKFVAWGRAHGLRDWKTVELDHSRRFSSTNGSACRRTSPKVRQRN